MRDTTLKELFNLGPPHPCERLARIGGQSNFTSMLTDTGICNDTTQDMAALAFARRAGHPELLEAYWGGSRLYEKDLCFLVYYAIYKEMKGLRDRDRVWILSAVRSAFDAFCGVKVNVSAGSRKFKLRKEVYLAMHKLAEGIFRTMTGRVQSAWIHARYGPEPVYVA